MKTISKVSCITPLASSESPAVKNVAARLSVKFILPCGTGASCECESIAVMDLARQLSSISAVKFQSLCNQNRKWEIVLAVRPVKGMDDDHLLENTLLALENTLISSEVLFHGFRPPAYPRMQFMVGGEVVYRSSIHYRPIQALLNRKNIASV